MKARRFQILLTDFSQLVYYRPIDRGYIVDAPTQSAVWQHAFAPLGSGFSPSETQLLLTAPPFVMRTVEAAMGELVFESHGFASLVVELPATLAACTGATGTGTTGITVDSGFSSSHIVPLHDGRPLSRAIRRCVQLSNCVKV
jgi:actin-related protein 6